MLGEMAMGDENRRAVEQLIDGLNRGDVSVMDEVFHDDAIMEWPQSRERIRGAERRRAVYGRFETLPTIAPRRLLVEGDLCVAEARLDYDGTAYDCVFIFELRDGRIAKETAYWSQPFEAPAWRADLVERI
jgi:ketosteroid isomerase-like protein